VGEASLIRGKRRSLGRLRAAIAASVVVYGGGCAADLTGDGFRSKRRGIASDKKVS
jgi:hypothetical protein